MPSFLLAIYAYLILGPHLAFLCHLYHHHDPYPRSACIPALDIVLFGICSCTVSRRTARFRTGLVNPVPSCTPYHRLVITYNTYKTSYLFSPRQTANSGYTLADVESEIVIRRPDGGANPDFGPRVRAISDPPLFHNGKARGSRMLVRATDRRCVLLDILAPHIPSSHSCGALLL